jgi:hypothetical protein
MRRISTFPSFVALVLLLSACQQAPKQPEKQPESIQNPVSGTVGCDTVFSNFNNILVSNKANRPHFKIDSLTPPELCQIETYHWNGGNGKAPGTIGLKNITTNQNFGPWPAVGQPGQGPTAGTVAQNITWVADIRPRINLPPGEYEVIDSDPDSWSWNSNSLDKQIPPKPTGFAKVWCANSR